MSASAKEILEDNFLSLPADYCETNTKADAQTGEGKLLPLLLISGAAATCFFVYRSHITAKGLLRPQDLWRYGANPPLTMINCDSETVRRFKEVTAPLLRGVRVASGVVTEFEPAAPCTTPQAARHAAVAEVLRVYRSLRSPCVVYRRHVVVAGHEPDLFRVFEETQKCAAGQKIALIHTLAFTADGEGVVAVTTPYHGTCLARTVKAASRAEDALSLSRDHFRFWLGKDTDRSATLRSLVRDGLSPAHVGPDEAFTLMGIAIRWGGALDDQTTEASLCDDPEEEKTSTRLGSLIKSLLERAIPSLLKKWQKSPDPRPHGFFVIVVCCEDAFTDTQRDALQKLGLVHENATAEHELLRATAIATAISAAYALVRFIYAVGATPKKTSVFLDAARSNPAAVDRIVSALEESDKVQCAGLDRVLIWSSP